MVVIYAENRSFDHLYGMFPGAEGIADASAEQKTQLDHDGRPLPFLPPVYAHGRPDARYPIGGMPNGPFRIDAPPINGRLDAALPSPWHLYYQNREQINGGKNNMFVAVSNVGGWVMGYFDGSRMKLWSWAREYTLADHFFMAAFGGSTGTVISSGDPAPRLRCSTGRSRCTAAACRQTATSSIPRSLRINRAAFRPRPAGTAITRTRRAIRRRRRRRRPC